MWESRVKGKGWGRVKGEMLRESGLCVNGIKG